MTQTALLASNLARFFGKKNFPAVKDISFSIEYGTIYSLLGPNGAGKTTTVRMCSTLLTPSSGTLIVGNTDAIRSPEKARQSLGLVLGGELGFYPRATAQANLSFFSDVANISSLEKAREIDRVLDRVDLSESANKPVGEFSRGMKQRLHIARAILGQPKILLLDEPTAGLDPEVSLSVRSLIRGLADEGTAVLLTSHSMPEIEELASRIAVVGAGEIVVEGGVQDIARFAGISITTTATLPVSATASVDLISEQLSQYGVVDIRPKGAEWYLTAYWHEESQRCVEALKGVLLSRSIPIPTDLFTRKASLEDAYLALADGLKR